MTPPFDFNLWDNLDEDSVRLTQTSEFWIQVQSEAETFDLVPPNNFYDALQDDEDWSILPPEEAHKDTKVLHDCMWAGSCTDLPILNNTFVPADLISATPGQSLLRRDISPSRPDTPPSLDGDEPPQFRHAVDVASTARRLLRDTAVAVAADHSYTLARQQPVSDYLGVQTPSDSCESEEEIDVVGDTMQQTLMSPTHVRTDMLPRVPSMHQQQQLQRTISKSVSPRPPARKRLVPPAGLGAHGRRARGPGRRGRRSNTDTDSEAESPEIERRSIHNDMERLRRIGLKNLFDELKKQIPATRDKERAPKVVILREAAALCRKLNQEDIEREKLKKKQTQLMTKLKKLRTVLSMRYRSN